MTRKRCLGRLRTVRFTWGLMVAEVLFLLLWVPWQIETSPKMLEAGVAPYLRALGLMVVLVAAYAVFLVWYRRRTLRELRQVEHWMEPHEADKLRPSPEPLEPR